MTLLLLKRIVSRLEESISNTRYVPVGFTDGVCHRNYTRRGLRFMLCRIRVVVRQKKLNFHRACVPSSNTFGKFPPTHIIPALFVLLKHTDVCSWPRFENAANSFVASRLYIVLLSYHVFTSCHP